MTGFDIEVPLDADDRERALMEALARLADGIPRQPELAERRRAGRLRITLSSLATEAGVDRRLVTGAGARYPRVLDAFERAIACQHASTGRRNRVPRMDLQDRNEELTKEIARLRSALGEAIAERDLAYGAQIAGQFLLQEALRQRRETARSDAERAAMRRAAEAMTVGRLN